MRILPQTVNRLDSINDCAWGAAGHCQETRAHLITAGRIDRLCDMETRIVHRLAVELRQAVQSGNLTRVADIAEALPVRVSRIQYLGAAEQRCWGRDAGAAVTETETDVLEILRLSEPNPLKAA